MKILSLNQIKKADQYCIDYEDISSVELMERAAKSCFNWMIKHYHHKLIRKIPFIILVGNGKNGGDGLSLSKMLHLHGVMVTIYIVNISNHFSKEFIINKNKILKYGIELNTINEGEKFPSFNNKNSKLIDAVFGIGLNRSIKEYWKSFFHYINNQKFSSVISIDIPSGLFMEKNHDDFEEIIIKATHTLTFQVPKLPFFLPDYANYVGEWHLLNVGWKKKYTNNMHVKNFYIDDTDVRFIYKKRKKFSHKGNYGHGVIIGGSYGMIGSIFLSAKASFRIGIGKLSVYVPRCGNQIIQTILPEAIVKTDMQENLIGTIPNSFFTTTKKHAAIGIGMGMGKHPMTGYALESFLLRLKNKNKKIPMVIDADAINILSGQSNILNLLEKETILTPHQKEFDRLCGPWKNDYQKLYLLKKFSKKYNLFLVLKGAHTVISTPHGDLYFNSTGNPGMATAGSGDVLTGIITGLLAQGYSPKDACIMGVYLHGLAGDIASKELNEESIMAMDIINYIGKAYQKIKNHNMI
ncbi:NAD(P)H-hydrate dehydratase [Blattabacterium cuenoti]|uniref:NAD(P)H-hydrate dehydratase n=1 Tax=Blattabacterium cuenoti TaxID=1653831 RepID=UPI00163C6A69|nr:NAD(P)H-hydrate dehydratase [Blattabacterium cuenoti]